MTSNEEQSWPNFRLRIGENLLFEVKHQVEEVCRWISKITKINWEVIWWQKVITIETLDENTGDILEENEETNMPEEELENFKDDWNKVCQNIREFYPSLDF